MKHFEEAKMLVSFFNMQAGTKFRLSEDGAENRRTDAIDKAIDNANGNIDSLKNHIKSYIKNTPVEEYNLRKCFSAYIGSPDKDIPTTATEITETKRSDENMNSDRVASSFGILEQALMEVIKKQSIPTIEADIKDECTKLLQDFIKKEYGTIERKCITVIDGAKKELPKGTVLHEQFDNILKFVANNRPVYLYGPAGSGKNHICQQIADALGLKFYFTNNVTQEYKLTGFTDANGKYQPTQFYKAFKDGGLFMLDEMDASIPETLTILNAAIANRYFDFPAPIGMVKAHKDFRIVAAGNTLGHGADYEYCGRNQLDGASLDRFATIEIDYCVDIENTMANGDIELADFCRDVRKASKKCGVQMIVSYRAINNVATMMNVLSLSETLQYCLFKYMEKDDIRLISNELKNSKFKDATLELIA